jgi:chromosome partitioning protein
VAATEAGENVVVLDLDPQGSLAGWGERRDSETPAIDRLVGDRQVQLPQILKGLEARGFTLVVLDCPGFLSTAGNMVMECIDLALVPTRPTTLDLHAAVPTTRALGRFQKQFLFVLNQCLPGSKSRANEAAAGLKGARVRRRFNDRAADRPPGRPGGRQGRDGIRTRREGGRRDPRAVGLRQQSLGPS